MKSFRGKLKKEKETHRKTISSSNIPDLFPRKSKKSLDELILSRNWKEVRICLFDKRNDKLKVLLETAIIGEISCLHSLCALHPPLVLVVKTVDLCPRLILHKDHLGRLPLHIAAGWGASPQIVSFLLAMNIDAPSTPDLNGKTPLIWAFENMKSPRLSGLKNTILADMGSHFDERSPGPLEEVVQSLVDASLEAVNHMDYAGNTALDYAIENECNRKSLTVLQIATARDTQLRNEMKTKNCFPKTILSLDSHDYQSLCKIHPLLDQRKKSPYGSCANTRYSRKHRVKNNHECTIDEDRFNDQIMDFLGMSTAHCNLDEMTLDYLREHNLDSLRAAQFGFGASKHRKPPGIPLIIKVIYCSEDDYSEVS